MMKRLLVSFALAVAVAAAGVLSWQAQSTAQSTSFDEAQVGEIEQIVRDYLLENPQILREVLTALEAKEEEERVAQAAAAIDEHRDDLVSAPDEMVLGNPDGDVTLVEFFDYNCGYCKRALPDLQALLDSDPNLRVVLKEFPILSDGSVEAARASIAAANQGRYREFHFGLLGGRGTSDAASARRVAESLGLDMEQFRRDIEAPETAKLIEDTKALATSVQIQGTPAYVIGDTLVPGAIGVDGLRQVIEQARAVN